MLVSPGPRVVAGVRSRGRQHVSIAGYDWEVDESISLAGWFGRGGTNQQRTMASLRMHEPAEAVGRFC